MNFQSEETAVSSSPSHERSALPIRVIVFRFALAALTIGAACYAIYKLTLHTPGSVGISSDDATRVRAALMYVGIPSLVIAIGLLLKTRWAAWLAIAFDALFVTIGLGVGLMMRVQHAEYAVLFGLVAVSAVFLGEGVSLLKWLSASRRTLSHYWAVVGVVFVASFGWGLHSAWFPGTFVYSNSFWEAISYDHGDPYIGSERLATHSFWRSRGLAQLRLMDPYSPIGRSPRRLKLSHDRTHASYLLANAGEAMELVVIDLTADPDDPKKNQHSFPLKQYHIASDGLSNLEWSPDDKTIAYAESQRLHLIDATTGKLTSVPLPPDAGLAAIEKEWLAERKPPMSEDRFAREMAGRNPRQPLGKQAADVVRLSAAGIRTELGLPQDVASAAPGDWLEMVSYTLRDDVVVSSFLYSGRSIRWLNAETILCDNLRLTLSRSEDGKVSAVPNGTPLPSVFFARPMWSPKGDKAAYLLNLAQRDERWRDQAAMLVLVDSAGKVLGKRRIKARVQDGVRWSEDGRRVAVFVADPNDDDHFDIYDTSTFRRLEVTPLEAARVVGGGAQWDWVCP